MKYSPFIFILLIYILANYYVFHRIWVAMPPNLMMKIVLVIFAVLATSAFFVSFLFGELMPIPLTSIIYKFGSYWMFILIYFVLIFGIQDLILLINKGVSFLPSNAVAQFSKANGIGVLMSIAFVTLLMIGGYLKYQAKKRVYLPIELSKQMGDSIRSKPLRIVAISDLHLGYTIGSDELEKWVELVNAEKPDLIVIGGDLIDNSLRPLINKKSIELLRSFDAPLGVYACTGNHEYLGNTDLKQLHHFFEDINITLLRDNHVEIDSTFYIVGRDDRSNSNRKSLTELVSSLDKTKPIFLLDHQPYELNKSEENGIDFQFSGHTHKGQVWPLSILTGLIYEKDHGYLKKGNTQIYVSSGIGIWGGKFRIGTQSEYVVIDIK